MRLQVVVDDSLGNELHAKAHDLGLSTSSYVRYLLKKALHDKVSNELDMSVDDLKNDRTETLSLQEFKQQLKLE